MVWPLILAASAFFGVTLAPKAANAKTPANKDLPVKNNLPRYLSQEQLQAVIAAVNAEYGNPFRDITILAIAKIESGDVTKKNAKFDSQAYRFEPHLGVASYGVFQTLSTTAADMGLTGSPDQLYNPYTAARIAIKYLLWIQNYLKGKLKRDPSLREILYCYNGGVGTFLRNRQGTPATRKYVQKFDTAIKTLSA